MALLEIENVTKRYSGLVAVRDVSFSVDEGEIVALIGPNGAGKTTLFDLITGVTRPTHGFVRFEGRQISGLPPYQVIRAGIGRTFQVPQPFPSMTVRENILVGAMASGLRRAKAEERTAEVLLQTHLTEMADAPARSLTLLGQKRLEIAKALSGRPRLLLLDEVMAGLRAAEMDEALALVRSIAHEHGVAILFVEHVVRAVMSTAQRIVVLHYGGKIAEGAPSDVAQDPKVITAYLGEGDQSA